MVKELYIVHYHLINEHGQKIGQGSTLIRTAYRIRGGRGVRILKQLIKDHRSDKKDNYDITIRNFHKISKDVVKRRR